MKKEEKIFDYEKDIKSQADFIEAIEYIKSNGLSENPEKSIQLTFHTGTYVLYGEWHLKCNVEFIGVSSDDGEKPSILIDKSVIIKPILPTEKPTQKPGFPLEATGLYSIIELGSMESASRINCRIENLTFGTTGNIGDISDNALFQRHLIEVQQANICRILDTDINLNNGQVTLIDIRDANDIVIENCNLFNDTVSNDNTNLDGGVIFIRGAFNSCRIANNHFMYYGSDEMIAVTPHHGVKGWWRKVLVRENFELIDNKIIYGHYPSWTGTVTDHEAAMPVYHSCDKLITFISSNEKKTADHADTSEYPIGTMTSNIWKNFRIAGNEMDLYDRVQYVFHIPLMEHIEEFKNFVIDSNHIYHHPTEDQRHPTGLPVCDIFAGGETDIPDFNNPKFDPIIIRNNNIITEEIFKNGDFLKHRFIELAGWKIESSENTFDASKCILIENNERIALAITTTKFGGSFSFHNDIIRGISDFASLSHGQKEIPYICGEIKHCIIDGSISMGCGNVAKLILSISENVIFNHRFYFLGQRCGKTGIVNITRNAFQQEIPYDFVTYYFPENKSNYNLQFYIFTNNVLTNNTDTDIKLTGDYPNAVQSAVKGNLCKDGVSEF